MGWPGPHKESGFAGQASDVVILGSHGVLAPGAARKAPAQRHATAQIRQAVFRCNIGLSPKIPGVHVRDSPPGSSQNCRVVVRSTAASVPAGEGYWAGWAVTCARHSISGEVLVAISAKATSVDSPACKVKSSSCMPAAEVFVLVPTEKRTV